MEAVGRCYDGQDETIASPRLVELAVLSGIGRMTNIRTVTLKIGLKDGIQCRRSSSQGLGIAPRTVLIV